MLSFADRAPGLSKVGLGWVRQIGQRIEMRSGYDFIDRSDVPFAYDTIGHMTLWFIAGLLCWWLFGRRSTPTFIAISLFAVSAGVEVAQGFLASTRTPDVVDLAANGVGIALGVFVGVTITMMAELFQRGVRSLTR